MPMIRSILTSYRASIIDKKDSCKVRCRYEDMFGTTSKTEPFTGRKVCAALFQVKSLEETLGGT